MPKRRRPRKTCAAENNAVGADAECPFGRLPVKLSGARSFRRQSKALSPEHRHSRGLAEADPRVRSSVG